MGALCCGLLDGRKHGLIIVGLDAAGKTTWLYRMQTGQVVPTDPTIVSHFEEFSYKNVSFSIWDLGGQMRHRPLWKYHYQGTKGILFVVDSSDRQRMHEARTELHNLLQEDKLKGAALMVVANKQDVVNSMGADEIADVLGLQKVCGSRPWYVQPTSALSGEGMGCTMEWVARMVRSRGRSSSLREMKEEPHYPQEHLACATAWRDRAQSSLARAQGTDKALSGPDDAPISNPADAPAVDASPASVVWEDAADQPSKVAGSGGNDGMDGNGGGGGGLEGGISAFKAGVVDADSTLLVSGGERVDEGLPMVHQQHQGGAEDYGEGGGVPNTGNLPMSAAAAVANTGVSAHSAPPVHESRRSSSPAAGEAPEASDFQQVMATSQDVAASPAAAERLPIPKATTLPTTRSLPHLVKVGGGEGAISREGHEGGGGGKGRWDEHGPTKAQLVAAALKALKSNSERGPIIADINRGEIRTWKDLEGRGVHAGPADVEESASPARAGSPRHGGANCDHQQSFKAPEEEDSSTRSLLSVHAPAQANRVAGDQQAMSPDQGENQISSSREAGQSRFSLSPQKGKGWGGCSDSAPLIGAPSHSSPSD